MNAKFCWCGGKTYSEFTDYYLKCENCGGLLVKDMPSSEDLAVNEDDIDFYGKEYWLSHVSQDYDQPDIYQRARSDLSERCIYWLKTLMKYTLPAARCLELGCAHGGFVAIMRWAGYDSIGLELSSWITQFAQKTFDIPVLCGPIEQQDLPSESFDAIILMDVLEHLPTPLVTMDKCTKLLKPSGFFMIQTPCFKGQSKSYTQLLHDNDPFVRSALKKDEHLFLFTEYGITMLMEQVGCPHIYFEPALFPYDMFLVAGRSIQKTNSNNTIHNALKVPARNQLIQALFDLDERFQDDNSRQGNLIKQQQGTIQKITRQLEDLSKDYNMRGEVIDNQQHTIQKITRQLEDLSKDYNMRGEVIDNQQHTIQKITRQLEDLSKKSHESRRR